MGNGINSVLDFINITYTSYVGTILKDSSVFVLLHSMFESLLLTTTFLVPQL